MAENRVVLEVALVNKQGENRYYRIVDEYGKWCCYMGTDTSTWGDTHCGSVDDLDTMKQIVLDWLREAFDNPKLELDWKPVKWTGWWVKPEAKKKYYENQVKLWQKKE